ncbi:MAG: ATP-binding protein, partial [Henriciella sp.]|uniref:ATP-binding protein n=1 Tax=Henriciella sp. TaxID=1968823 RepID=UPI003C73629A
CGGFSKDTAKNYAFRFGRPSSFPRSAGSIGQFGVGMKRALLKFGSKFEVHSSTDKESWAVGLDVDEWLNHTDWHFPWIDFESAGGVSESVPGTRVEVTDLRAEVSQRFGSVQFVQKLRDLIKTKHREFIADRLHIEVNEEVIDATKLALLVQSDLKPGYDEFQIITDDNKPVHVKILVGVGQSSPREAGWYVVCNGRVILSADRDANTGWGKIEEESNRVMIPSFHNQFARFRGVVWLDSDDSSLLPWNTQKTDIDVDNVAWRKTFNRMVEMMRPVINWLNDLDADIDEHTRKHSALLKYVESASSQSIEMVTKKKQDFEAPRRDAIRPGPPTTKIQYSRPVSKIEELKQALSVNSAVAVGEKTFDLIYAELCG